MADKATSSVKATAILTTDEEQPAPAPEPDVVPTSNGPKMKTQKHSEFDSNFIHDVIQDAGRWAYGVIFVEVWVLNADRTHLFRPEYGWWIDPIATNFGTSTKFDRLIDPSDPDYLYPDPLAPGVGLPGLLWALAKNNNAAARRGSRFSNAAKNIPIKRKKFSEGRLSNRDSGPLSPDSSDGGSNLLNTDRQFQDEGPLRRNRGLLSRTVVWHQVGPLADDPDQPYNPRLHYLASIGLGWAAGIPFHVGNGHGIVIYMARDTADSAKLHSKTNEDYLIHASLVIGAAYTLRGPRMVIEEERRQQSKDAFKRATAQIIAMAKFNKTLDGTVGKEDEAGGSGKLPSGDVPPPKKEWLTAIWKLPIERIRCMLKKSLGAGNKAPPPFTWRQTTWTFVGSFLTLCILTTINQSIVTRYGNVSKNSIVLGPFGALMTLQYGLTAAPASQPRNAIMGQFIGLFIAFGIGKSLTLPLWLKQTLATSLAIGCMVKLGVTHPPAGASALLFSSGQRTWDQVGWMFVGNVVAIVCATIINNFSDKRQYPTFWGFQPVIDLVKGDEDDTKQQQKKKE